MLEVCPTYTWTHAVLRRRCHRKREAAFAALQEYVTVQRLKGLKCAVVCFFMVKYLISQN